MLPALLTGLLQLLVATGADSLPKAAYRVQSAGSNSCAMGTARIVNAVQCESASAALVLEWRGMVWSMKWPKGCYTHTDGDTKAFFNIHPDGGHSGHAAPICAVLASAELVAVEVLATADKCQADYGVPVNGAVCCGQVGSVSSPAYICTARAPTCIGFIQGVSWGSCHQVNVSASGFVGIFGASMRPGESQYTNYPNMNCEVGIGASKISNGTSPMLGYHTVQECLGACDNARPCQGVVVATDVVPEDQKYDVQCSLVADVDLGDCVNSPSHSLWLGGMSTYNRRSDSQRPLRPAGLETAHCTVEDSSAASSIYPCMCGTTVCEPGTVCSSASASCQATCTDTEKGTTDKYGSTCSEYRENPVFCGSDGWTDDSDFSASSMCCACGGGVLQGNAIGSAMVSVSGFALPWLVGTVVVLASIVGGLCLLLLRAVRCCCGPIFGGYVSANANAHSMHSTYSTLGDTNGSHPRALVVIDLEAARASQASSRQKRSWWSWLSGLATGGGSSSALVGDTAHQDYLVSLADELIAAAEALRRLQRVQDGLGYVRGNNERFLEASANVLVKEVLYRVESQIHNTRRLQHRFAQAPLQTPETSTVADPTIGSVPHAPPVLRDPSRERGGQSRGRGHSRGRADGGERRDFAQSPGAREDKP